jgi:hypothetical protein
MTRYIRLPNNRQLPIYILRSSEDKAQGFQGYREIPTQYGLWFTGVGGSSFHMRNVAAPLLAVGFEDLGADHFRVVSASIWEPNLLDLKSGGTEVLECNPSYQADFTVGQCVHLSDSPHEAPDPRLPAA